MLCMQGKRRSCACHIRRRPIRGNAVVLWTHDLTERRAYGSRVHRPTRRDGTALQPVLQGRVGHFKLNAPSDSRMEIKNNR